MSLESSQREGAASNFGGDKIVTKKTGRPPKRILFRDLARLAQPKKTERFLAERTGSDARTAKRWLSGASRAPDCAVYAVLADIFARLD